MAHVEDTIARRWDTTRRIERLLPDDCHVFGSRHFTVPEVPDGGSYADNRNWVSSRADGRSSMEAAASWLLAVTGRNISDHVPGRRNGRSWDYWGDYVRKYEGEPNEKDWLGRPYYGDKGVEQRSSTSAEVGNINFAVTGVALWHRLMSDAGVMRTRTTDEVGRWALRLGAGAFELFDADLVPRLLDGTHEFKWYGDDIAGAESIEKGFRVADYLEAEEVAWNKLGIALRPEACGFNFEPPNAVLDVQRPKTSEKKSTRR